MIDGKSRGIVIPLSLGAALGAWLGPEQLLRLSKRKLKEIIGILLVAEVLEMIVQSILTLNAF